MFTWEWLMHPWGNVSWFMLREQKKEEEYQNNINKSGEKWYVD